MKVNKKIGLNNDFNSNVQNNQRKEKTFFSRHFFKDLGIVESVGDGIINILGLQKAANGEMVEICTSEMNQKGLILNLGPKWVSAVALSSDSKIKPGQFVFLTHELMSIPVGDALLGRVVNPLGEPIDDKGNIKDIQLVQVPDEETLKQFDIEFMTDRILEVYEGALKWN